MDFYGHARGIVRYGTDMATKESMRVTNFKIVLSQGDFTIFKISNNKYEIYDRKQYRYILSLYDKAPVSRCKDVKEIYNFLKNKNIKITKSSIEARLKEC